jgi:hypothetical protein
MSAFRFIKVNKNYGVSDMNQLLIKFGFRNQLLIKSVFRIPGNVISSSDSGLIVPDKSPLSADHMETTHFY